MWVWLGEAQRNASFSRKKGPGLGSSFAGFGIAIFPDNNTLFPFGHQPLLRQREGGGVMTPSTRARAAHILILLQLSAERKKWSPSLPHTLHCGAA